MKHNTVSISVSYITHKGCNAIPLSVYVAYNSVLYKTGKIPEVETVALVTSCVNSGLDTFSISSTSLGFIIGLNKRLLL